MAGVCFSGSPVMISILSHYSSHHAACDEWLGDTEAALDEHGPQQAQAVFERFCQDMNAHFDAEEQVLFPAFEMASGMHDGPTRVMCAEHAQMRVLMDQVATDLREGTHAAVFDTLQLLYVLMRTHNLKEEQVLYPACDRVLPDPQCEAAIEAIAQVCL